MSGVFCTNNAQAPSLFSNVTLTSRRSYVETDWKKHIATGSLLYSLTCTICSKEYIGETQRPIRARVQEHFTDTRNRRKDTPWGEHVLSFHKDIDCAKEKTPIFTARILAFEENVIRRKAREAIEIRDRRPEVNRNGAEGIFSLCLSILFLAFERCVNVSNVPSFKAVQHFWRDFLSKIVTDDDVRKETFFLASRGEDGSLITVMEYCSSVPTRDRGMHISSPHTPALRALQASKNFSCPSTSKFFHFLCLLNFKLLCLTMSPSVFSFKMKEQLFEQTSVTRS